MSSESLLLLCKMGKTIQENLNLSFGIFSQIVSSYIMYKIWFTTAKIFPNEILKNNCDYILMCLAMQDFIANWQQISENNSGKSQSFIWNFSQIASSNIMCKIWLTTVKIFPNEILKNNCDYILKCLVMQDFMTNWLQIWEIKWDLVKIRELAYQ